MRRLFLLAAGLAVLAAACAAEGGGSVSSGDPTTTETSVPTTNVVDDGTSTPAAAPSDVESALQLFAGRDIGEPYPSSWPPATVDTVGLLRGQIPDGIPAIDEPQFVSVDVADVYLDDREAVVVLNIDGDVRAYPVQILIWHEIVNDVVGGTPVSITYCPLCNSAVSYERIVNDEVTTFGTSGLLFNSALVMYDRLTESLWTHYNGEAIAGSVAGAELDPIASPLLGWAEFRATFPDGLVLDKDNTGHARSYGANPYPNYDNPSGVPFLFRGEVDERLGPQRRVTGVAIEGVSRAWTVEAISGGAARATNDSVGDRPVVVLWRSGQATALESGQIAGGRDVGSVGVFVPEVDGEILTFRAEDSAFVDEETGSTWNVFGEAIDGPLAGSRLTQVPHLDTFWFAWAAYNPGTSLSGE